MFFVSAAVLRWITKKTTHAGSLLNTFHSSLFTPRVTQLEYYVIGRAGLLKSGPGRQLSE